MAAEFNFQINKGNSLSFEVALVDGVGDPITLTGTTFTPRIYSPGSQADPVATLTVGDGSTANARTLSLTAAETDAFLLTGSLRWELEWLDSADVRWDLVRGDVLAIDKQQANVVDNLELTVTSEEVSVSLIVPGTQGPAGPPGDISSDDITTVAVRTQAQYNALTPDAETAYFIIG